MKHAIEDSIAELVERERKLFTSDAFWKVWALLDSFYEAKRIIQRAWVEVGFDSYVQSEHMSRVMCSVQRHFIAEIMHAGGRTMSKYTPGPWTVGDGTAASNYEGSDCVIVLRNDRPTTTLVKVNAWFGEESLANALLVAAAPDLLQACHAAYRLPRPWIDCGISWPEWDAVCALIENAIAKAEGAQ